MQYLWGTTKLEVTFCENLKLLVRYTDLDWVEDLKTCRSTSGYLFNIGSGVISWSSKKQSTISLSSYKAEYIMQTQVTKKTIWLQSIFSQLVKDNKKPTITVIFRNNQNAITLAKNLQFYSCIKHIII